MSRRRSSVKSTKEAAHRHPRDTCCLERPVRWSRSVSPREGTSLPISLVAHTVFCERRAWLESVGERVESRAIEDGVAAHAAVNGRADDRVSRRRSVEVASERLGVNGRCDVIDVGEGGDLRVVEYKSAPLRRSTVVTAAQRVQLALQGMCLEEAGHSVVGYGVYFTTGRRLVDVVIDEEARVWAREMVAATRRVVEADAAPPPLLQDPRCGRCSHAGVCLPEERALGVVTPHIKVADPDGEVLHLTTPGARAYLRAGRVEVVKGDESLGSLPLDRVQAVVVHGNVDLSTALVRELMWMSRSIIWCSGQGRVVGFGRSVHAPNGGVRVAQHVAAAEGRLDLAREFVMSKISNQATLLRRGARWDVSPVVREMRRLARAAGSAQSIGELFGQEGAAAALYFGEWTALFSPAADESLVTAWLGRVGRGADDPVNVALNYCYGILSAEMIRAILACGLDPHAGFLHSSSRNKPALALDLMEQFRPVVADSVVLGLINNGELRRDMFSDVLGTWRLRDEGRRRIARGFERRVEQRFTHPLFGYRVSWRRAVEIQSRLVLGVLDGTQDRYVGIRVR
nr:CRISPR-associated endonuclease Cas1 [Mobilicoccus caccae]